MLKIDRVFMTTVTKGLMALLSVLALSASVYAVADVSDVRFGGNMSKSRVVIDMSKGVAPKVFMLADPYRVVIDLPSAKWSAKQKHKPTGLISSFRHGLFQPKVYRIVLDLKRPAVIAKTFTLPPTKGKYGNRVVIDLTSTSRANFIAAVDKSRKARVKNMPRVKYAQPNLKSPKTRNRGSKRIITIDPGHGGIDPGTLGRYGKNEDDLTLLMSSEIKRQLEATRRYKVVLTRSSDVYVKHRRRYEIGRKFGSDLFISIHVDSVDNPKTRGGSVYTLSERSSDKEAARLAARENKSDLIAGVDLDKTDNDVSGILIELAQRETMNYSARFAEVLVGSMRNNVRMLKTGHRYASLMVLKAPDMPSVLIETGFQTNRQDAKVLNSRSGRSKIARGIVQGVDNYFNSVINVASR